MEKIFCMNRAEYTDTPTALQNILLSFFGIENARILRTKNGKPYLEDCELFFSVSHTKDKLFIVFSDQNVGIDAESMLRNVDFTPIVKKFSEKEKRNVTSKKDFLRNFTAKESAVKWLDSRLSKQLFNLQFIDGELYISDDRLPVNVFFFHYGEFLLSVVSEKNIMNPEFITL